MLTIALTHYNRPEMLFESIERVIDDPRVDEVVISDDASADRAWWTVEEYYERNPKVRLFRNDVNIDCYHNKAAALERCQGSWTVLFDSDNIMDRDYLDVLEGLTWDERTAYLPTFAEPHFDYRKYEGLIIDHTNVARHMDDVTFRTALNTANHLCFKTSYLACFNPDLEPHTADSIYMNYRWLAYGNRLYFVPGLRYLHRVHPGSHYQNNVHKTGDFAVKVERMLRAMR